MDEEEEAAPTPLTSHASQATQSLSAHSSDPLMQRNKKDLGVLSVQTRLKLQRNQSIGERKEDTTYNFLHVESLRNENLILVGLNELVFYSVKDAEARNFIRTGPNVTQDGHANVLDTIHENIHQQYTGK